MLRELPILLQEALVYLFDRLPHYQIQATLGLKADDFIDCVVGPWSHRMKSLVYYLLTSARFPSCLKARSSKGKEKVVFLSSWGHRQQQGGP